MTMPLCPMCFREMYWQNDYDMGDDDPDQQTFTDFLCKCGVMVTIPWNREEPDDDKPE